MRTLLDCFVSSPLVLLLEQLSMRSPEGPESSLIFLLSVIDRGVLFDDLPCSILFLITLFDDTRSTWHRPTPSFPLSECPRQAVLPMCPTRVQPSPYRDRVESLFALRVPERCGNTSVLPTVESPSCLLCPPHMGRIISGGAAVLRMEPLNLRVVL